MIQFIIFRCGIQRGEAEHVKVLPEAHVKVLSEAHVKVLSEAHVKVLCEAHENEIEKALKSTPPAPTMNHKTHRMHYFQAATYIYNENIKAKP